MIGREWDRHDILSGRTFGEEEPVGQRPYERVNLTEAGCVLLFNPCAR